MGKFASITLGLDQGGYSCVQRPPFPNHFFFFNMLEKCIYLDTECFCGLMDTDLIDLANLNWCHKYECGVDAYSCNKKMECYHGCGK